MVTKVQLDNLFMTLACDQSRLVHLIWNGETSQQTFPWLGINDPHHSMSHVPDGPRGTQTLSTPARAGDGLPPRDTQTTIRTNGCRGMRGW